MSSQGLYQIIYDAVIIYFYLDSLSSWAMIDVCLY